MSLPRKDWDKLPIGTLYTGLFDGPHATPKPADSGPVFLGIKNITEDGKLDLRQIRHIAEEDFPRWTRRVVPQGGDIVFSYEATLHRYAMIPDGFRGCLGRRLALIRPDAERVDGRFLFFYFFGEEWRSTVAANTNIGSTVDRIPLIEFPKFPVSLPPLPTQRKIAAVLSAYDELIENNLRRMQILEEMTHALYREWFVRFRFPGHKDVCLTDSRVGQIPEDWEVKKLCDLAAVNARSINKRNAPDRIRYIDISSVSPGRVEKSLAINFDEAPSRARRIVQPEDILWSCVRPNRRSHALVLSPKPNTVASTGFAVISPEEVPFSYLYLALTTPAFVGYLANRATGAAYPAVSAAVFEAADVLLPPPALLVKFHSFAEPFFRWIDVRLRQNLVLQQARDLLLPRLISGKIDVSDLDIEIGQEAA